MCARILHCTSWSASLQVFDALTGAAIGPIDAGTVVVRPNTISSCHVHTGTVTVTDLQTDSSYIVHAVAEDLNQPVPNRMTALCSPDALVCRPCDPLKIKVLQVPCECQGHTQVQVTLQAGRVLVDPSARGLEGVHVHYLVLEAALPTSGAKIDSTAFPTPTVAQVRQGHVRDTTPTAVAPVASSLCVGNDVNTTFTVPGDDSGIRLAAGQHYVVCVAPPESGCPDEQQSASEPATCVPFATQPDTVPLVCALSECSCDSPWRCSAHLTCNSSLPVGQASPASASAALAPVDQLVCSALPQHVAPALLRYSVVPSDCSGLRGLACSDFFYSACPRDECCPRMDDDLHQRRLGCCPAIAQGDQEILPDTSTRIDLPDMASCGDVDIIACAAQTPCQRCPCSETCVPPPDICEQPSCTPTQLQFSTASNGTCVPANPPAAASAPAAISYSDPQLFIDRTCGDDHCEPGLCEVTICEPDGICEAEPSSWPSRTTAEVYAIRDSPGTTCCMALPYTAKVPAADDIMAGDVPSGVADSAHSCAFNASAGEWHTVGLQGLDDGLWRVRPLATLPQVRNADRPVQRQQSARTYKDEPAPTHALTEAESLVYRRTVLRTTPRATL